MGDVSDLAADRGFAEDIADLEIPLDHDYNDESVPTNLGGYPRWWWDRPAGSRRTSSKRTRNSGGSVVGEMADYHLEHGENSSPDFDEERRDSHPGIVCRYCQCPRLHWELDANKWRLYDHAGIHNCPVNPLQDPPPTRPPVGPSVMSEDDDHHEAPSIAGLSEAPGAEFEEPEVDVHNEQGIHPDARKILNRIEDDIIRLRRLLQNGEI